VKALGSPFLAESLYTLFEVSVVAVRTTSLGQSRVGQRGRGDVGVDRRGWGAKGW
jgi:hypothetical protein